MDNRIYLPFLCVFLSGFRDPNIVKKRYEEYQFACNSCTLIRTRSSDKCQFPACSSMFQMGTSRSWLVRYHNKNKYINNRGLSTLHIIMQTHTLVCLLARQYHNFCSFGLRFCAFKNFEFGKFTCKFNKILNQACCQLLHQNSDFIHESTNSWFQEPN